MVIMIIMEDPPIFNAQGDRLVEVSRREVLINKSRVNSINERLWNTNTAMMLRRVVGSNVRKS